MREAKHEPIDCNIVGTMRDRIEHGGEHLQEPEKLLRLGAELLGVVVNRIDAVVLVHDVLHVAVHNGLDALGNLKRKNNQHMGAIH